MDDSDDYFNDSLILDDSVLAILQQEEDKHVLSENQQPVVKSVSVAKPPRQENDRHRFGGPPKALLVKSEITNTKDIEDFPDIILHEDGSYGVQTRPPLPEAIHASLSSRALNITTNSVQTSHVIATTAINFRKDITPSIQAAPPSMKANLPKHSTLSRNPSFQSKPTHIKENGNNISKSIRPPLAISPTHSIADLAQSTTVGATADVEKELAYLRAQLEESNRARLAAEKSFKEAQDARFAKEGEVTLLRKKLEKEAKEHADKIANLKSNVANAEAAQAKMQKDVKEEMERLRTQFVFKQHEIESSIRNPLNSARSKRILNSGPQTPVPVPPVMKTWKNQASRNNDEEITERTPKRRRGNTDAPIKSQSIKKTTDPQPAVPGYENSFFTSPTKSPASRLYKKSELKGPNFTSNPQDKGKGKEAVLPQANALNDDFRRSPSPRRTDFSSEADYTEASPWKSAGRSSSPFDDVGNTSFGMDTDFLENADQEREGAEAFVEMDWKDLYRSVLFSHSTKFSSSTIQGIISDLPSNVDDRLKSLHRVACENLLEYLGARYNSAEVEEFEEKIANTLVMFVYIFKSIDALDVLLSLMDLLTSLTIFISSFCNALLSTTVIKMDNSECSILDTVCDIIKEHVQTQAVGEAGSSQTQRSETANAILALLDAICWTTPENCVEKLSILPLKEGVLLTLLDPQQQQLEVISRTTQLLVVLANYPTLFRPLLSFPMSEDSANPSTEKDYSRIPLIEKLCGFLIDPASLKEHEMTAIPAILNFFALLSYTHPDGLVILQESNSLIPSLIYYLTQLTTMVWEDDKRLIESSEMTSSTIYTANQALYLLYHLVFSQEPVIDLRHKIHHASHRHFNGLSHMFIVMIGRMSYADAPDWLTAEQKTEIEKLIEPARDLLEMVVEGPEVDSIWAAYQDGDEDDMDVDVAT